jgi:plasmid stabilization system protein ParE
MAVTYKVVITPDAQICIQEILDYLIDNVSVEVADKVSRAINDKIQSLKTFPESHDIVANISKRSIIYRRVMAMSYRIVYTVQRDKVRVIVVDVDHGSRNPERLKDKFG